MKNNFVLLLISIFLVVGTVSAQRPRVFLMNDDTLLSVQSNVFRTDKRYMPAVKRLLRDAEKVMKKEIVTITEKEVVPPSGDKHDYYSLSRYWWPDPKKEDGLPYIRNDGVTNPEAETIPDHTNLNQFFKAVTTLGLAYYFTGDEKYAQRSVEWLNAWFVDPETKMNPNLRFAQQIRGRNVERGTGILDAREFSQLVDAIGFIRMSRSLPAASNGAIDQWFKEYLAWLVESPNGKSESNARNNHGTWYDVHTTSIALFVGDKERARTICEEAKEKRIAYQITPEGKQPEELERTLSWHYSQFNLLALTRLAQLASNVGVDLWNYETADGRSIRRGLDYMIPFAYKEKTWEDTQIKDFKYDGLSLVAIQAAWIYREPKYLKIFERFFEGNRETDRIVLQYGIVPDEN